MTTAASQSATSPSRQPPPCPVTVDGELAVVRPASGTDSVDALARALGAPPDAAIAISAMPVNREATLAAAGLAVGATVTIDSTNAEQRDEVRAPDGPVEAAVLSGPACQPWRSLSAGRHSVGRSSSATVRVVDPTVELHHGFVDVTPAGEVRFTQLTGRIPVSIEGRPCAPGEVVDAESGLTIGASRVVFRPAAERTEPVDPSAGSLAPTELDPWRRVLRRAAAVPRATVLEPIPVPAPPPEHRSPPLGGLVGAAVAAAGAGLMAIVLGQAMFALFAVVGAVASIATWAGGAIATRRRRSRSLADHRRSVAQFLDRLDAAHVRAIDDHRSVERDVIATLADEPTHVWRRRAAGGSVAVTLGRGTVHWRVPVEPPDRGQLEPDLLQAVEHCERLVDVAVPWAIEPGSVTALYGDAPMATAVARSVVVQLAANYGPADVGIVVVTDRADAWSWARWLPHRGADGRAIVRPTTVPFDLAPSDSATVVVTDAPALLTTRTGWFRRMLDASGASCIVITPRDATIPSACSAVLEVGTTGAASWRDRSLDALRLAGIDVEVAERVARRVAPLIDPEDDTGPVGGLPRELQLGDIDGVNDAATIARRWRGAGRDPALAATIGLSTEGAIEIDLVRDGPHGLIAGTTGSGKSELLRTLVVMLAARVGPDFLSFVLIDFKGGSTFDVCERLTHTVGVVTDLDEGLAGRALVSLDAEIRRREHLLRNVGVDDLAGYRQRSDEPLPRIVVIIDEFATLAKELPDFLEALVAIAQRGRSLGLHLLLATQRPAGVVTDDIRANTNLRLALRLQDRGDAIDVIGDARPAGFTAGTPGRAAMRLAADEVITFQAASCTAPLRRTADRLTVEWPDRAPQGDDTTDLAPTELEFMVDAVNAAASIVNARPPHRPWVEPLPDVLGRDEIGREMGDETGADRSVLGLIDDPGGQTRRPLRWDRSRGNLLLAGSVGTGTTTTALAIARSIVASTAPEQTHLYVVDGHGEPAMATLADTAHCGAVIAAVDDERIDRLLHRLVAEIDRRTAGGERRPEVVLVVDGLGPLRSALAGPERATTAASFDRVIAEGPAVGVVTCATTDRVTIDAFANAQRWQFHLDEASPTAGPLASTTVAGRLRLADSGLIAQVVFEPDASVPAMPGDGGPPPVDVLPERVDPAVLTAVAPIADDTASSPLLIGLASDDLAPAFLDLPDGDHLFIGGAARTGASTALRRAIDAWSRQHPESHVIRADRRRSLDRDTLGDLSARMADTARSVDGVHPPLLIAVDDADRVDDPGGALAAIVAARRPEITVFAAARYEAVRVAYGHWVREVTRSRCGLVMTSTGEVDGDLLGVVLPRRSIIRPRPGLAWMVDRHGHRLVQVADRMRP